MVVDRITSVKKAISSEAAYSKWRVQRKRGVRKVTSCVLRIIEAVDIAMTSFSMPPVASFFLEIFNKAQKKDEGRAWKRALKWKALEGSIDMLQRDAIYSSSDLRSTEARLDNIQKSAQERAYSDGVVLQF